MTKRRLQYSALLISVFVWTVVRQLLGGQPAFPGEFVIEDFILLLTLAMGLAPSRFKPLFSLVIVGSMGVTMALTAWAIARTVALPRAIIYSVAFVVLAIYIVVRALSDLSELRKRGPMDK
jgi:hypothetical protein